MSRKQRHKPQFMRRPSPPDRATNVAQALGAALEHHRAGRLAEAEALYRQILQVSPRDADALHLLGVLAHQVGQHQAAVELIDQAIAVNPRVSWFHSNRGNALRALRRPAEAVASYEQALRLAPGDPEALTNLGNALRELGRPAEAVAAYERALAARPNLAEAHSNLGNALRDLGRLDEAVAAYRRALAARPDLAEAHSNLGNALRDLGRLDEAVAAYQRATALRADYPEAHNNLGAALQDLGRATEGLRCHERAVALRPDYAEAHFNMGRALHTLGRLDEAAASYRRALHAQPGLGPAAGNLGNVLRDQGRLDEAVAAYRQAVARCPASAELHSNLGAALCDLGRLDEAIAAHQRALDLEPTYAEAYANLGTAQRDQGALEDALASFERALSLRPDLPEAHTGRGLVLLLQGNYVDGFAEYEWRWRCREFTSARRELAPPRWDGEPLAGRTLLVHAEQGFGDTLQFARFVSWLAGRGERVVFECQPELLHLLDGLDGAPELVGRGQPLPPCDLHAPLMSLPLHLGLTLDQLPGPVPYLQAPTDRVAAWAARLAAGDSALKVGLVWSGNPRRRTDRARSMALAAFEPLGAVPGVRFYSLQRGPGSEQAVAPPPGLPLVDLGPLVEDFADTAAALTQLDLLITVDTAAAHLAGALGRPVWILQPYLPDWRWLLRRDDSPWYPTARLFRQTRPGDWAAVVDRLAAALVAEASRRP